MKLLFDANISRKIVPMIEDLFQGSSHVALLGLSGETDFLRLSAQHGAPPKVIRFERMNYSTEQQPS